MVAHAQNVFCQNLHLQVLWAFLLCLLYIPGLPLFIVGFNKFSDFYNWTLQSYCLVKGFQDEFCQNNTFRTDVSSQKECQQKCIEKINCVGISYSYKSGSTHYCYLCEDDKLRSDSLSDFGFYRRPYIVGV